MIKRIFLFQKKMIEFLKLLFSKNKTLTLALVASLLVHILIASKFIFSLPELDEGRQAINVRLVNVQAMQQIAPAPTIKAYQEPVATTPELPQAEPETITNEIGNIADGTKAQETTDVISPVTSAGNMSSANQPTDQSAISATNKEEVNAAEVVEVSENIESTEEANLANKTLPEIYNYIETEFEVRRGNDSSAAGVARIVFILDKNHTYMLTSMTQAKGLASLFFNTLSQKSVGVFTDQSLIPNHYSYQYGNDPKKDLSARFNWSEGTLLIHNSKGDKTEILNAGTQDLLSFMYQFMFIPPLENTEIIITNGKNMRTYSYHFQGEEQIATKLGELSTIHLIKTGDDDEKTELWLALDYQYLPVKIRKTEKDGSFIEQTVTSIYTKSP
jgi:hypothetical protein